MAMWFMKLTVFLLHCTPLFIIFCLFSSRLHPLSLFYLTNWLVCSAQKFTQCLLHMAQGIKKIYCSIHCTNRKNNYFHCCSPNTYLYSFPWSGKLKGSKGSLCQYLCCREWVQKNTQWCYAIRKVLGKPWATETVHNACISISRRFFKS